MNSFFKGRDIWIVSSVCLVASFLWSRLWDLLSYRRKGRGSSSADAKVGSLTGVSRGRKRKPQWLATLVKCNTFEVHKMSNDLKSSINHNDIFSCIDIAMIYFQVVTSLSD